MANAVLNVYYQTVGRDSCWPVLCYTLMIFSVWWMEDKEWCLYRSLIAWAFYLKTQFA